MTFKKFTTALLAVSACAVELELEQHIPVQPPTEEHYTPMPDIGIVPGMTEEERLELIFEYIDNQPPIDFNILAPPGCYMWWGDHWEGLAPTAQFPERTPCGKVESECIPCGHNATPNPTPTPSPQPVEWVPPQLLDQADRPEPLPTPGFRWSSRYEGKACQYTNGHICKCNNIEQPLLIDGDSVKLGPKVFSPKEIQQLKTRAQGESQSTYEVFEQIDRDTLNCRYDYGTIFLNGDRNRMRIGQHIRGRPAGQGITITGIGHQYLNTQVLGKGAHGFEIHQFDNNNFQHQKEIRAFKPSGLSTGWHHDGRIEDLWFANRRRYRHENHVAPHGTTPVETNWEYLDMGDRILPGY